MPAFIAGAFALRIQLLAQPVRCLFKQYVGIPCPTCGMTRLGFALLRGEIFHAFAWNPGVFLGMFSLTFFLVLDLWAYHRGLVLNWEAFLLNSKTIRVFVALVFALNWAFLIWAGR